MVCARLGVNVTGMAAGKPAPLLREASTDAGPFTEDAGSPGLPSPQAWVNGTMLGFDLETTGTDPLSDVPVSVAFVGAVGGSVGGERYFIVDPGREVPAGAAAIHGITTERARAEGMPLEEAARTISGELQSAAASATLVVAMNAAFDLTMAEAICIAAGVPAPSTMDLLVADILVIDREYDRYRSGKRTLTALCEHYGVELGEAHNASGDAQAALSVLIEQVGHYPGLAKLSTVKLMQAQSIWHRGQVRRLSEYFVSQGRRAIPESQEDWPIWRVAGSDGS